MIIFAWQRVTLFMHNISAKSSSVSNMKSINRTLEILSTFTAAQPQQRVTDIAEKLGMNISTVSRHLSTMLDSGFLERDSQSGMYRLGIKFVTLAGVALYSHEVYRHSYPELLQLSHKTGLHCIMGIPEGKDVVHLISVGSDETIEFLTPIGYHHPMYCSGMGRAIMSQMSQEEIDEILDGDISTKYADDTKATKKEILEALKIARKKGYATIVNELNPGKSSISAPIFAQNRQVIAAISMTGNIFSLNLEKNEEILSKQLLHSAGKISGKLGFFPK